jgi:FG-GAP repeat
MKELTMEMLASAKAIIPIHSPSSRGTWRQALCLLSLAALSLTIGSCGSGNDSPQTSRQIVAQLVQQGYLKASNTDAIDVFGYSLALAGDTLVVGAPGEASAAIGVNGNQGDDSAPNSGAVYVFTRTGSNWSQQAYLKATNTQAGDGFGESVALAGDTLAVGVPGEDSAENGINGNQGDNGAVDSGAVYVFTRSNGVWSQQAYLKATNTQAGDGFGESVALTGDTLAVGATGEDSAATGVNGSEADNSAPGSGAVYVFTRTGSDWNQQAYVKASIAEDDDLFGVSVALAGDTLAVGAPGEDSNATGIDGDPTNNSAVVSGAVYIFTRSGSGWSQQAYLKATNTQAGDGFGESVALTGDTLAVGATGEDSAATGIDGDPTNNSAVDSGAVYVFTRSGSGWSQQAYVKASNAEADDGFGYSVALANDTLAVGATGEASANGTQGNNSAPESGAVYVFTRTNGVWSQQAYVKASNAEGFDLFGSSIALAGDTLAVGAFFEASNTTGINGAQGDNNAPDSGAAYVFSLL